MLPDSQTLLGCSVFSEHLLLPAHSEISPPFQLRLIRYAPFSRELDRASPTLHTMTFSTPNLQTLSLWEDWDRGFPISVFPRAQYKAGTQNCLPI